MKKFSLMMLFGFGVMLAVSVQQYHARCAGQLWNLVDAGEITGASCYTFTNARCPGDNDTCEGTLCTSINGGASWQCNETTHNYSRGEYFSGTENAENGGWNLQDIQWDYCIIQYTCGTCSTSNEGIWYCTNTGYNLINPIPNYQKGNGC